MHVDMRPQHTSPPRRSFSLACSPTCAHAEEQKEVWRSGGGEREGKKGQSSEREGARGEVAKKKTSLPQPEQRGSPSTQQPSQLQPLGCQTWWLELGSIRRASFL